MRARAMTAPAAYLTYDCPVVKGCNGYQADLFPTSAHTNSLKAGGGLPGAEPIRVKAQAAHQPQWRHSDKQPTHAIAREGAGER